MDFVHFTCAKLVLKKNGKKMPLGMPPWKDKTVDEYRKMRNPSHNVKCVLTGKINDITVIDFDNPYEFDKFIRKYPVFEDAYTVKTSKGFHVYSKYNPQYLTTTNTILGVDIRNDQAIVFGAGTVTEFGTEYTHYRGMQLDLEMPRAFYNYVKPKAKLSTEPFLCKIFDCNNF